MIDVWAFRLINSWVVVNVEKLSDSWEYKLTIQNESSKVDLLISREEIWKLFYLLETTCSIIKLDTVPTDDW